jgi:hypothetical protein
MCFVEPIGRTPRYIKAISNADTIPKLFEQIKADSVFNTMFDFIYQVDEGILHLINKSLSYGIQIVPYSPVQFCEFLNQPYFEYIQINTNQNLTFTNLWDRQNLYLHSNFYAGNVLCRMPYMQEIPTRFYNFDNKAYVEFWFSTNGENEIDILSDFFIELDLYQF